MGCTVFVDGRRIIFDSEEHAKRFVGKGEIMNIYNQVRDRVTRDGWLLSDVTEDIFFALLECIDELEDEHVEDVNNATEQDELIIELEDTLEDRENTIHDLKNDIQEKDDEIYELEERVQDLETDINEYESDA